MKALFQRSVLIAFTGAFTMATPDSAVRAQAPRPDAPHFSYDKSAPLDVRRVSAEGREDVTVEDIIYTGANGDIAPAYLVIPKGSGKYAGIIWGHWLMEGAPNANRSEFLDEAIALASNGVVSLLIDAPYNRPGFKSVPGSDTAIMEQQVVDLRRGVDLLLSRSDIDATKVAYVGHSFDAAAGAILDAIDKRLAAFVFMGGPRKMDMPEAKAWADPGSYASKFGPAPAFFQYGLHDEEFVPPAVAEEYVAIVSGPKQVRFYDAGHALNAEAQADRDAFLKKMLKLKSQ